jgi:hypothetical protein
MVTFSQKYNGGLCRLCDLPIFPYKQGVQTDPTICECCATTSEEMQRQDNETQE